MTLLDNKHITLIFDKIDKGFFGKFIMEIKAEHRSVEIIEEDSLYIIDLLQNVIEKLLSKNEIFYFENFDKMNQFAKHINISKINSETEKNEAIDYYEIDEMQIEYLEIFNTFYFGRIKHQIYLNLFSNIRNVDGLEFWKIDRKRVELFIESNQLTTQNFEINEKDLAQMSHHLNQLRTEIGWEVFKKRM